MTEDRVEYLAKKAVLWGMLYRQKIMQDWYDAAYSGVGMAKPDDQTALPPKVCYYGKPKLYWFGEVHGSNNYIWNEGYTMARHWDVTATKLHLHTIGDTVEEYNPLKGKRFVGISEPAEHDVVDHEFLKRFTGDEWVETTTLNKKSSEWKPQGEIFVMSGQPLRMNDRSKEAIEKVRRIEFPEAH